MECPYLEKRGRSEAKEEGNKAELCAASLTMLAPDACTIGKYCSTEEHYRCPMLLANLLMGGKTRGKVGLAA